MTPLMTSRRDNALGVVSGKSLSAIRITSSCKLHFPARAGIHRYVRDSGLYRIGKIICLSDGGVEGQVWKWSFRGSMGLGGRGPVEPAFDFGDAVAFTGIPPCRQRLPAR